MMLRSRLLDKGREEMLVYPQVFMTDDRGHKVLVASDTPVKIMVTATAGRSSDAELAGNVTAKVMEIDTRSAPVGSRARVFVRGEYWDIAQPPVITKGLSKATSHVYFVIRSRNHLDEVIP